MTTERYRRASSDAHPDGQKFYTAITANLSRLFLEYEDNATYIENNHTWTYGHSADFGIKLLVSLQEYIDIIESYQEGQ